MSTNNDQSTMIGTTPTTTALSSQGITSQEVNKLSWQGLQIHKSGTIYTHSYAQTNKYMYDWILLNTCSSIDLFCNQSFVHNVHWVNIMLSLTTNAGVMTTNLKTELPGYGTIWFDPHAMTNVLSFGNTDKQYHVRYLQQPDLFQVQLSNWINIFGHEQVDNLYIVKGN